MAPQELFPVLTGVAQEQYRQLLADVKAAADNHTKGTSLEVLADFLFGHSKCFASLGPKRTSTGQIDHLVERLGMTGLFLDEWTHSMVVECKNWAEPIGAPLITVLAGKAEKSRSNVAILFSRKGITGTSGALGEVRNCYSIKGIAILVLDEADLQSLAEGGNLIEILRKRWFDLKTLA